MPQLPHRWLYAILHRWFYICYLERCQAHRKAYPLRWHTIYMHTYMPAHRYTYTLALCLFTFSLGLVPLLVVCAISCRLCGGSHCTFNRKCNTIFNATCSKLQCVFIVIPNEVAMNTVVINIKNAMDYVAFSIGITMNLHCNSNRNCNVNSL